MQIDAERSEVTHGWPEFLTDGQHFIYFARSIGAEGPKQTGIFVASLDAREAKLIVNNASNPVYAEPGYLLFVRDGNLTAQGFDARRLETTGEPVALARGVSYNRNWDVADFSASGNGVLTYRPSTDRPSQLVKRLSALAKIDLLSYGGFLSIPATILPQRNGPGLHITHGGLQQLYNKASSLRYSLSELACTALDILLLQLANCKVLRPLILPALWHTTGPPRFL